MFVVRACCGPQQTKSLSCRGNWDWAMMTQEFPDIFMFLCTDFQKGYFYSVAFFHVSSVVALIFCDFASVFPLRETDDQVGGKAMSKCSILVWNFEFGYWQRIQTDSNCYFKVF